MDILHNKTQFLLETIAFEPDCVLGIHAYDAVNPGVEFDVNADEVFPTASIIKIPILLEFYRQVSDGILIPNEIHKLRDEDKVGGSGVLQYLSDKTMLTLEDWVKLMINISDNTATNYLMDIIGVDNVNKLLESFGLENTKLLRKMQAKDIDPNTQENLSTPRELSNLLMMIMNHQILEPEVCENTLNVLKLHKDGIIRDALPGDYVVANKNGWMGAVQCDTGIVYAHKPYIVTVMAKNIPEWDRNGEETKETMRQAVSQIHTYYQSVHSTSKYGRRVT